MFIKLCPNPNQIFFFCLQKIQYVTANQKIQAFQLLSFLIAMRQGNTQVEILFKSNQNEILITSFSLDNGPSPEPNVIKVLCIQNVN